MVLTKRVFSTIVCWKSVCSASRRAIVRSTACAFSQGIRLTRGAMPPWMPSVSRDMEARVGAATFLKRLRKPALDGEVQRPSTLSLSEQESFGLFRCSERCGRVSHTGPFLTRAAAPVRADQVDDGSTRSTTASGEAFAGSELERMRTCTRLALAIALVCGYVHVNQALKSPIWLT